MSCHRISVVTINLNNADGLRKTMQSVINQDYPFIEYIVIDGGSTDGSVEVIKQNQEFVAYWISEKDSGIYNAMNKGVSVATGEYILFLNSGDLLDDRVLHDIFLKNKYHEDILYGDCLMDWPGIKKRYMKVVDTLNIGYFFFHTLPHQSVFIKRDLFKYSIYREDYKIVSDWIFFFDKIIINKSTYKYINRLISIFDMTGMSNQNHKLLEEEKERYMREVLPSYVFDDYQRMAFDENFCPMCNNLRKSNSYKLGNWILSPFIYLKRMYM